MNSGGHIFAGRNVGGLTNRGILRSTDSGGTWAVVLDSTWVSALAINDSGHIFAGGNFWNYGGVYSISRSTDNGASWTELMGSLLYVEVLTINDSGHIFAGTNGGGVFRSIDNGTTWDSVNAGLTNRSVGCLTVNSNGYIFAGTGSGVFRSVKSTTSVREVSSQVPKAFALEQNFPNPFSARGARLPDGQGSAFGGNPSTTIRYSLPS